MKRKWSGLGAVLVLGAAGSALVATPAYADGGPDLRVEATAAHGKVGDTVSVNLKLINEGPGNTATGEVIERYVAPGGTELVDDFTKFPGCHVVTAGHEVWCYVGVQIWAPPAANTSSFTIHLKIDSATVTPGRYTAELSRDPNQANNSAAIVVTVDGVTPSPTATAKPTATPKPTTKPSATRSATAGPTATSSASTSASALPVTGSSNTGLFTGVGAVLLAAGAVLLGLARRRRA